MNLIIFGPQGSGKGTYASLISPKLGITHISSGDIFRDAIRNQTALGKEIEDFLKKGILVPDEITIQVMKERFSQPDLAKGFILDGFPRTMKQAEELERAVKIDAVINLVVPEWILLERLSHRVTCEHCKRIYNLLNRKPKKDGVCDNCGGRLIQRSDETPEAIRQRLRQYRENSEPLIEYFKKRLTVIDSEVNDIDSDAELIAQSIIEKLKKIEI